MWGLFTYLAVTLCSGVVVSQPQQQHSPLLSLGRVSAGRGVQPSGVWWWRLIPVAPPPSLRLCCITPLNSWLTPLPLYNLWRWAAFIQQDDTTPAGNVWFRATSGLQSWRGSSATFGSGLDFFMLTRSLQQPCKLEPTQADFYKSVKLSSTTPLKKCLFYVPDQEELHWPTCSPLNSLQPFECEGLCVLQPAICKFFSASAASNQIQECSVYVAQRDQQRKLSWGG